eukprot:g2820.t1
MVFFRQNCIRRLRLSKLLLTKSFTTAAYVPKSGRRINYALIGAVCGSASAAGIAYFSSQVILDSSLRRNLAFVEAWKVIEHSEAVRAAIGSNLSIDGYVTGQQIMMKVGEEEPYINAKFSVKGTFGKAVVLLKASLLSDEAGKTTNCVINTLTVRPVNTFESSEINLIPHSKLKLDPKHSFLEKDGKKLSFPSHENEISSSSNVLGIESDTIVTGLMAASLLGLCAFAQLRYNRKQTNNVQELAFALVKKNPAAMKLFGKINSGKNISMGRFQSGKIEDGFANFRFTINSEAGERTAIVHAIRNTPLSTSEIEKKDWKFTYLAIEKSNGKRLELEIPSNRRISNYSEDNVGEFSKSKRTDLGSMSDEEFEQAARAAAGASLSSDEIRRPIWTVVQKMFRSLWYKKNEEKKNGSLFVERKRFKTTRRGTTKR